VDVEGDDMSEITGDTSDGYHTFNELYEHRHTLFAFALKIARDGFLLGIMPFKTWRNQNGEEWEGWFIAGLNSQYGQISYHLPAEWWDELDIPEIEYNADYDGHTSADVLSRLKAILQTW
jgi:hypothetical protein